MGTATGGRSKPFVAAGTPPPVDALDSRQTAYLAEAAGASLRPGRAVELKTDCEVSWHKR